MDKTEILGVQIDAVTRDRTLNIIRQVLVSPEKTAKIIATTYSEFVVQAQHDREFKQILNAAFLNLPDGIGILWAASFLKRRTLHILDIFCEFFRSAWQTAFKQELIKDVLPEKISGADVIWDIAKISSETDNKIYLLGSYGDVSKPLLQKYPSLKIAGRDEALMSDPEITARINAADSDVLFVAFNNIQQYKWLAKHQHELKVKLAIGLGGTFDYLTGRRSRAGSFWVNHGLEWLYRLFTQPWRATRMWNAIIVFSWLVLRKKLRNTI